MAFCNVQLAWEKLGEPSDRRRYDVALAEARVRRDLEQVHVAAVRICGK